MTAITWIGILGSVMALGFIANGVRMIRSKKFHASNAGQLHIATAVIFMAVLWAVVLGVMS
ncbi:MAG: hypothetical protein AAGK02_04230 [Pseudomonadota bacterium]